MTQSSVRNTLTNFPNGSIYLPAKLRWLLIDRYQLADVGCWMSVNVEFEQKRIAYFHCKCQYETFSLVTSDVTFICFKRSK